MRSHWRSGCLCFLISETADSFASLGMTLNAILTVLLVPLALAGL